MVRFATVSITAMLATAVAQGCSNLVETRTIERFTEALEKKDLVALKTATTGEFDQKALRLAQALDDFEVLSLPEGKTSIVKVEETSESEKQVVVEVGERKRKLLYKLAKNPDSGKWVVDDIYIRQRRDNSTAAKSVTEQMDLLLTVREFLSSWGNGDRNDVLAIATADFAQVLDPLPPAFLAHLTDRTVGGNRPEAKVKPQAQMDERSAVVKLPRTTGTLLIQFKLVDGRWLVDDLAAQTQSENDRIPSARRLARVMLTAATFLKGYRVEDHQALSQVCTSTFYHEGLAPGDLSLVDMPPVELPQGSYEIRLRGRFADFIIDTPRDVVKLSLVEEARPDEPSPTRFLVEDVTIYELDGTQNKRLSAFFTSHAMVNVFSAALATRDLSTLRYSSTSDFNQRVWERLTDETLRTLPLTEIDHAQPAVLKTLFQGAVTQVVVQQGPRELTYVLHDRNGQMLIDDIMLSIPNRPDSLKLTLELLLPLLDFAAGVRLEQIDLLQRVSSQDFNRVVWHQTKIIPTAGRQVPRHLSVPLTSIEYRRDLYQAILTYGDENFGAKVLLVKEGDRMVVDEMLLVSGTRDDQRTHAKRAMKIELAEGLLNLQHRSPAAGE